MRNGCILQTENTKNQPYEKEELKIEREKILDI